jgi:hypothetical protein
MSTNPDNIRVASFHDDETSPRDDADYDDKESDDEEEDQDDEDDLEAQVTEKLLFIS